MAEITFGVNIVEIVTHGLYPNSLDTLREYIQNSCDAIDDAIKGETLNPGEGRITIDIDEDERRITIEDNGVGIATRDFERVMGNIGNSDKRIDTNRGFRGIGRLGGLAYCKELIFTSKAAGERKISVLRINAEKLRKEFFSVRKRLAEHVLLENMRFETVSNAAAVEHFFRVEMIGINETNKDLLDIDKVRDYLSFVAPVIYSPDFDFRKEIYAHAAELGFKISEYDIRVNDKQLVKNYKTNVRTKLGADEIFGLEFRDIYNEDGELIAWSWIGLSQFKGVLSEKRDTPSYKMRGIRLRQKNIQIGDEMVFQERKFFGEERGTKFFIGEIHTVDKNLIPNSRRDYFEENNAREAFESALGKYFAVLKKLYNYASGVRNAFKATNDPEKLRQEIARHTPEYQETHKAEHDAELAKMTDKAEKQQDKIDSIRREAEKNPAEMTSRVFEQIDAENSSIPITDPTPPPKRLPLPNWSPDKTKLYNEIHEIILANKKLSGVELIEKFEEVLG